MAENQEKSEKLKKSGNSGKSRKLKYGAVATAITCTVTAVVIIVNVLVSILVEKYPLKLDLTEDAKFEISQESMDYLKSLDQEVNFTVFMSESNFQSSNEMMKMIHEILARYAQYSDKIHLSYVDPTTNPDVVNLYQADYTGTLTEGDIVISDAADNSKMRIVNIGNLFSYDQQKYYRYYYYGTGSLEDCITGFQGEQNLTSALMYVTDADPVTVGVLTTANGQPLFNANYHTNSLNALTQTLFKNGYDMQAIDLYTGSLDPEVYDMLILPAPVNDLTANGIESLSAFLYNNGDYNRNLIYIADFTQSDTPNLDEFLETWGIQVTKNIAVESDANAAQQVALSISNNAVAVPVATVADEKSGASLVNTSLPVAAPLCRTINLLWDSKSSGITSVLLKTSDSVYLNQMNTESESKNKEPVGAQNIMVCSSRRNVENNITHESNLLVIGSMLLSDSNLMQDASYNNASYLVSAANMISGKGSNLVIASKELTNETITITTTGMRVIYVVIFMIPSIVAAVGVWVFLRRRNK
ncbi:MAG: GldG family protein [Oscillospiraceae bacterium]|nr:GldG family protein [Oscillospiraceae bacterium]